MASKLSVKLLVDKKTNKVMFAEAGKDFVDFLLAILALPVGNIMKIIHEPSLLGCMGNLYESLQNWNSTYFQDGQNKDTLLKSHAPINATGLLLPFTEPQKTSRKLYRCNRINYCVNRDYVTEIVNTRCPAGCSGSMNIEMILVGGSCSSQVAASSSSGGSREKGLVKGLVTYMVTDDLSVTPLSMITLVSQLAKFNLQSLDSLETMTVDLGINEAVKLLKASLKPESALTDVFLKKK